MHLIDRARTLTVLHQVAIAIRNKSNEVENQEEAKILKKDLEVIEELYRKVIAKRHGYPWAVDELDYINNAYASGLSLELISAMTCRSIKAVKNQLKKRFFYVFKDMK